MEYFTKFERTIWCVSVIAIVASFFIFGGDGYLSMIASLVGVTSLLLCAKGNFWAHVFGIIFSLIYGYISFSYRYYGEMITYMCMTMPMGVFALVSWIKNPYKGKLNFVGGKVEPGEDGVAAAYRELEEETSITHNDITLIHLMDMTYYTYHIQIQVYIGRLNKELTVAGEENQLIWLDADGDFEDMSRFAGEGNIAHIIEMIRDDIDHLLPDNNT